MLHREHTHKKRTQKQQDMDGYIEDTHRKTQTTKNKKNTHTQTQKMRKRNQVKYAMS